MSKSKQGKAGRNSPFTPEQNAIIEQSFPTWNKLSLVDNVDLGGRGTSTQLTEWKQKESKRILTLPEFETLPEGYDYGKTLETIIRKFTNYRSSRKRQMDDRTAEVEALKVAAAALVDLKSFNKGRTLFKREMHQPIAVRRSEILANNPRTSAVGAYQTSLKELWEEANQGYWERKAIGHSKDVHENQINFPRYLFSSHRGLCQAGGLGKLEMVTFFAYRDRDGRIDAGVMETHHNNDVTDFGATSSAVDDFKLAFEAWAKEAIPADEMPVHVKAGNYFIEENSDGIPVFPVMDLNEESPLRVRCVIKSYLRYLWAHSHPEKANHDIPWEKLKANPDQFYDTNTFDFGVRLTHPCRLSNAEVYDLASALIVISSISSPTPFEFWRTSEPPLVKRSRSPSVNAQTPALGTDSVASTPRPIRSRSESVLPSSPRIHSTSFEDQQDITIPNATAAPPALPVPVVANPSTAFERTKSPTALSAATLPPPPSSPRERITVSHRSVSDQSSSGSPGRHSSSSPLPDPPTPIQETPTVPTSFKPRSTPLKRALEPPIPLSEDLAMSAEDCLEPSPPPSTQLPSRHEGDGSASSLIGSDATSSTIAENPHHGADDVISDGQACLGNSPPPSTQVVQSNRSSSSRAPSIRRPTYLIDAEGNYRSSPPPPTQPMIQSEETVSGSSFPDGTPPTSKSLRLTRTLSAISHSTSASNPIQVSSDGEKGASVGKGGSHAGRTTRSRKRKENVPQDTEPVVTKRARMGKAAPIPTCFGSRRRKRPLQEMVDGDEEVVLNDGRRGVFKRIKNYQGAYFYEHGRTKADALWYDNPDELLSMPSTV